MSIITTIVPGEMEMLGAIQELGERCVLGRLPRRPFFWAYRMGELRISASIDSHPDTEWRHVAVSHADRYPTWDELVEVRYRFFSEDAEVLQYLPAKNEYVNLHPNCFHLWQRLDRPEGIPR